LPGFNPASAGAGVTEPSIATFSSVYYSQGYAGCYVGGQPELYHKYVIDIPTHAWRNSWKPQKPYSY